jgi:hypothetical protein
MPQPIIAMVEEYIRLRNQVAEKAKELKVLKDHVDPLLEALENQMLAISNETGVNSFATDAGTVFKTTKSYVSMADKEAFLKYAIENNDFGLITNHIAKAHAEELLEAGVPLDVLGIKYTVEQTMSFRKAS